MDDERLNAIAAKWTPAERRCYYAAERLLESAAYMAGVESAVDALDVAGPPALECFTGRPHLRTASRVGLFSGSFNPLTHAHIAIANAARAQARLDALVWTMSVVTVDKERVTRASVPDRLAQLVAFARPRRETVALINRGLYVDQVQALRAVAMPHARVYVVVGYDKVVQIFDARYYQDRDAALDDLFAAADLLVAPRDAFGASDLATLIARPENQRYASHVAALDLPSEHLHDSSTEARQLAAEPAGHADAVAHLVPPAAQALIATGAYAPSVAYALRQDWLAALACLPKTRLRKLPPLVALVARAERSPDLRSRLADLREHASTATVSDLLRAVESHPAGTRGPCGSESRHIEG